MDITKDVAEAIERSLPSAVGDVLKKRLEQAEKDARDLAEARAKIERLTADAAVAARNIQALGEQLNQHGELATREAKVAERERASEIKELTIKLEAEQRFGAKVTEAMLGLVRNVEYRHNWSGMQGFAAPNPNGSYGMQTASVGVSGNNSTSAG